MAATITALRFQQRDRERVNVYLDGAFAFGLPAVIAASLRIGQSLGEDEIASLQGRDAEQRAYERALRFLASRPRSTAEVRRNLEQQALPNPTVDAVIQRLLAAGYLDDEAFARFWVSNREQFRPRAPLALRQELRQKGIADSIINRALHDLDSENSAYRAGLAQARRYETLDQRTFRQKLGGHLLRRGFPHAVVWPVVEQLWRELREGAEDGEEENGWPGSSY
ncbi:MAG TPA: RecX family transcriptional regulator [Anaerolineae bacterium]|nr:RecX family transcriptional regulator [Anaerolineae bacterium]